MRDSAKRKMNLFKTKFHPSTDRSQWEANWRKLICIFGGAVTGLAHNLLPGLDPGSSLLLLTLKTLTCCSLGSCYCDAEMQTCYTNDRVTAGHTNSRRSYNQLYKVCCKPTTAFMCHQYHLAFLLCQKHRTTRRRCYSAKSLWHHQNTAFISY